MDQEAAYLSPAEVRRVLDRLNRADIVRLSLLARNWLRGLPRRSPDDLVNEAMERILSGRRPWPCELDWGAFFNGVMRSIADQWRKEDRRVPLAEDVGAEFDGPAPGPDLEAADLVGRMRDALAEDMPAREMFEHLLVDRDRDEIQFAVGMDETAFDTVRRRMFRHLRLAFVSGWKE
ncbi:DNA-directed RNA polymerase specialized sigma24 family protein [Bradyrhizobium sp. S3.12.5]|uniref:RNA polymerase sigma factor n=1 Tax=Bradyrhizobium sp. S3.12.5 TaxID=3156386 RepID=UPI003392D576